MKKLAIIGIASALPFLAFAQQVNDVQDAGRLLIDLINNVAVPIVFALAFIVFIWGVFLRFIAGGQDEEKRKQGQQLMLWGIVGFFIMVSVWGLVNILIGTVDLNDRVPEFPEAPETNR